MTRSLEVYGESCLTKWRRLAQLVKPGMTDVFGRRVVGLTEVNPANWTSPIRFRR